MAVLMQTWAVVQERFFTKERHSKTICSHLLHSRRKWVLCNIEDLKADTGVITDIVRVNFKRRFWQQYQVYTTNYSKTGKVKASRQGTGKNPESKSSSKQVKHKIRNAKV